MIKVNFELTEEESQFILNTLGELPYRQSAPLISKLIKQFQDQKIAVNTGSE